MRVQVLEILDDHVIRRLREEAASGEAAGPAAGTPFGTLQGWYRSFWSGPWGIPVPPPEVA